MDAGTDPDKVYIKVDEDSDPAEIAAKLTEAPGIRSPQAREHPS